MLFDFDCDCDCDKTTTTTTVVIVVIAIVVIAIVVERARPILRQIRVREVGTSLVQRTTRTNQLEFRLAVHRWMVLVLLSQ